MYSCHIHGEQREGEKYTLRRNKEEEKQQEEWRQSRERAAAHPTLATGVTKNSALIMRE